MPAPASPLLTRLAQQLEQRAADGTRRQLTVTTPGRVDFSSNDYLGLARSGALHTALQQAVQEPEWLAGSTGSRLLTGNSAAAGALETRLATFHRAESALLFNSGYTANLGFFGAVPRRGDTILYDSASHASVKDGIRSSFATAYSFRHNDLSDLEKRLQRATGEVFVAVEALYSMDGDQAPLQELAAFCTARGLHLVVDEAHTNGIYGPNGEGLVVELGLEEQVLARIVTFGKALGSQGAAVVGPAVLREFLLNTSRPFMFTTALAPLSILTLTAAYDLLPRLHAERQQLFHLSGQLSARLAAVPGLRVGPGSHVIHPLFLAEPGPQRVRAVASAVQQAGFDLRPIVAPTVPSGTERLRLILHSYNTEAELDALAQGLSQVG
ncbi:aminotransferase class I/II-fold pyridoxal phosphate-dependent enzyme [Hymenobacter cellulosilyticus]|uniref:8-amino-7-oxononanoate synthase n=1 Tax=Hymenobacter cellulosilyticus TaxID=2932248 RepID=A0A8T9Q3N8_9BACT|nr:8-amino-7-oxononanoate synthase [Hymenobacter cellulosilyticus]UOQ70069.1 8-amino-7-oxononanoate synthase [Hymenobacter cellulosilyticus]